MKRSLTEFRLIPIVLVAVAALLALKVIGLVTQGGYTMGAGHAAKADRETYLARETAIARDLGARGEAKAAPQPQASSGKKSWAQEMFFPDVTGSVPAAAKSPTPAPAPAATPAAPAAGEKPKTAEAGKQPGGVAIPLDPKPVSASERAVLERLTERRQELEQRARELDLRETLVQAAEKRIDTRAGELKDMEARVSAATHKKEEADNARLKSLVTMYESMKAKDAARIFDRLDIKLATEVASLINPRRMSDIMAQMSPEAAERLTVSLANRGQPEHESEEGAGLPKIEGRPNGT